MITRSSNLPKNISQQRILSSSMSFFGRPYISAGLAGHVATLTDAPRYIQAKHYSCTSFGMRIRSQAIRLTTKSALTPPMSRSLVLRIVPFYLPQPKMHSIILRRVCDLPQPSWRVVRLSMDDRHCLPVLVGALFCAISGVTSRSRRLVTWCEVS
jgi:hypothetical protein